MPPSIKLVLAGAVIGAIGVILWRMFDDEDATARVRHYELLGAAAVTFLGGALILLGLILSTFGG
ncbi:hypothetical protein ASD11_14595 [Aeromicrobium sp. Root495]|uniref:hypothetical protein n=1 Tax=Aeromicrobium sp. Root495 TaxID=1736550 RepID=UPI0006F8CCDB|nr:hypothetical protein [Aeromicrobium sp. Root495]KQY55738.1 hypothetical protein ASD11_14595 [Aeromicrobium sp. Root495]